MSKKWVTFSLVVMIGAAMTLMVGCESDAQTGAGVGVAGGALAGQLIGGDTESTLIGAGIGAGAGYMVGNERDKKKTKAEMDQLRADMNNVTVTITNSNGSKSQVLLRKQGVGYVGPRGEYYDHLPTDEELRPLYGI
ncbi:MAG: glycine zipper domain-containing protein [Planctomycetota bacterium]|jgi:hypothetical protein